MEIPSFESKKRQFSNDIERWYEKANLSSLIKFKQVSNL
jgi:hypothetical protein